MTQGRGRFKHIVLIQMAFIAPRALSIGVIPNQAIYEAQINVDLAEVATKGLTVTFPEIPKTDVIWQEHDRSLDFHVRQSASFVVWLCPKILAVKQLSFVFRSEGDLPQDALPLTKANDDALLRIGLVLHGPKPLFSWFAPSWLKSLWSKDIAAKGLYLVLPSLSLTASLDLTSPYLSDIKGVYIPCQTVGLEPSQKSCSVSFKSPLHTIALFFMADGDNTKKQFVTRLFSMTINE